KTAAPPVYLQGAAATTNSGTATLARAFSGATTAGTLLVAAVAWRGNGPLTLTDSHSNTYAAATTAYDPVLDQTLAILYAINGTADTTSPTVSVTSPTAGATVTGTITVMANASDDVGVAGVQFKLDGAPLGTEDTVVPYTAVWDTTATSAGPHTLTAVARDAA